MFKYAMSEDEKETFLSSDEGRGAIRLKASKAYARADTIHIVDYDDNLFGEVAGAEYVDEPTEPGSDIVLTDEQLEEQLLEKALLDADLARVEEVLKPQIYAKLRDEARTEIRQEFAELVRSLRSERTELLGRARRMGEGVNALARQVEELKTENALLKAEGQQVEKPVSAEPRSQL